MIFAREGANVVCADINAEGAKETADRLLTQGGKALALATDVTLRREVNEMVRRSIETFGPVQFQFNSAGAALGRAKIFDLDRARLARTLALHAQGTRYFMDAAFARPLA